jgi:hypothetical protein
VIKLEQAALSVPELREAYEQRGSLVKYWRACSAALAGSQLLFRDHAPDAGRTICRFKPLDDGVYMGAQYYATTFTLCVYFAVSSSAGRNHRRMYKDLVETHIPELETQIGETLHWEDPYFWVSIPADIANVADWSRQHQWVRDIGQKLAATFKARLAIV